ncbi:hypothetical protein [Streptomyces gobiensis]|uniref:hypothetical protein n=1 Tax=Streptomyces gobiensis TaxID=2875706 RepID=UPI001E3363B5|nr:hypothetical protein [Streptomyces gobiensis]UGY91005.1 hypothetical protein test1122_04200 [Streptomyces gobiensis]
MDAFYALAVLACPLGMGAMMWFMMKAGRQPASAPDSQGKTTDRAGFDTDPRQQEVTALRGELADLRAKLDKQPEQSQAPAEERTR